MKLKVNNKKLFKYILFEMIISFCIWFLLVYLIYPIIDLDVPEKRLLASIAFAIICSIVVLFDVHDKRKRSIIIKSNQIIYDYFDVEYKTGLNDMRLVHKKFIINGVDNIKITPMFIKVKGNICAPQGKLEIARIFENENLLIKELNNLKKEEKQ